MCPRAVVPAFACMVLAVFYGSVSAAEHPWSGAYVSVVSGAARLEAADERSGEELEIGMPLAEGDRIASGRGAFVEVAFRSGERFWFDADTDIVLQRIFAGSSVLLEQGALFVHVPAYAADDTSIDIVDYAGLDARINVRPGGLACIKLGTDVPLVVDLWAGKASVESAGNSVNMYPAQRLRLGGVHESRVGDFITEPGTRFEVQTFARLRKIQAAGRQEYLESSLQGIEDLEDHGRWYYDSEFSTRAWRPYVASDWRPFYNGRWLHHPRGVYWLAHDPWGDVTYHYGSWRYSRHGYWCWVPGYVFSPAAVRFYSSGDYLVWVPAGMHTRFTYGTWWPDDYYRYAVMCRRDSLYKKRGRHKGTRGSEDDGFERPRHGSRREVKEVDLRQLPAPQPEGKPEAGTGQKKPRPERRPGKLQAVPAGERMTMPVEGVPPAEELQRRSVEPAPDQGPVFNPPAKMPRSPDRDVDRLPGGIGQPPETRPPRSSSGMPGAAGSPPVFRTPQSGSGPLPGGPPSRRQQPVYSPQPRGRSFEPGTDTRSGPASQ